MAIGGGGAVRAAVDDDDDDGDAPDARARSASASRKTERVRCAAASPPGAVPPRAWRHVAVRFVDGAAEARRTQAGGNDAPRKRDRLFGGAPAKLFAGAAAPAADGPGGATLELAISGAVVAEADAARAPRVNGPLAVAEAGAAGFSGCLASLLLLSAAPSRAAGDALAARGAELAYPGASTACAAAACGGARLAALEAAQVRGAAPEAAGAAKSPFSLRAKPKATAKPPEAVFDGVDGRGGVDVAAAARSGYAAVERDRPRCRSASDGDGIAPRGGRAPASVDTRATKARSDALVAAAAAAALRRGEDPLGAVVAAVDGGEASRGAWRPAVAGGAARWRRRCAADGLSKLGGAAALLPVVAGLADPAAVAAEGGGAAPVASRLDLLSALFAAGEADGFFRVGGVRVLERCLERLAAAVRLPSCAAVAGAAARRAAAAAAAAASSARDRPAPSPSRASSAAAAASAAASAARTQPSTFLQGPAAFAGSAFQWRSSAAESRNARIAARLKAGQAAGSKASMASRSVDASASTRAT